MRPATVGLLLVILASLHAAPASASSRCGTMERIRARPARPAAVANLGGEAKQTRAGFPGVFQVRESANFALKWQSVDVDPARAQRVLDLLEASWEQFAGGWGIPLPVGADAFRVNVFISGPGDVPAIDEYAYAAIDDEGYDYIALGEAYLFADPDPEAVPEVVAHELYHVFESGLEVFDEPSAWWYWEASAEWAASAMYPELAYAYFYVGAYGLKPQVAMFFAVDASTRPLLGSHQYGAMLFLRHLTDLSGAPDLVVRSWTESSAGDDPLQVLDDLTPDLDVAQVFAEFAGQLVAWDFPQRDLLLWSVDWYVDAYPDVDRVAYRVGEQGTDGPVELAQEVTPRAFALALVELARPSTGAVRVSFEADAAGSLGSAGELRAQLVTERGDGISYDPIPADGALDFAIPADARSVHLVVSATSTTRDPTERFPFRFSVEPISRIDDPGPSDPEPSDPEPSDPGHRPTDSGGCSAADTGAGSPLASATLLLVALVLLGRARASRGARSAG